MTSRRHHRRRAQSHGRQLQQRRQRRAAGALLTSLLAVLVFAHLWGQHRQPDALATTGWATSGADHLFGADELGRDVAARVATGGLGLLGSCVVAGVTASLTGLIIALLAWRYRWLAGVVRAVSALVLALPGIAVVLLCGLFLSPSVAVLTVMVLLGAPLTARTLTAALAGVQRSGYVQAALLRGESPRVVLIREVLPAIRTAVWADIGNRCVAALQLSVALSVIAGGGANNWAGMVSDGLAGITLNPWAALAPALAVAITGGVISLALLMVTSPVAPQSVSYRTRSAAHQVFTPTNPNVLVQLQDVRLGTPDGQTLLNMPEFQLLRGQTVVVRGPSGSGKTTLLRLVAGLVPDHVQVSGRIESNFESSALRPGLAGRSNAGGAVAYVPQDPASTLDPLHSVLRAVRDGRRIPREKITESLASVGLSERTLRQRTHSLSGGEATRVAIARAVVADPSVLVLDEPTAGLDAHSREHVVRLLQSAEQRGCTIMLTTHDDELSTLLGAEVVHLTSAAPRTAGSARRGSPSAPTDATPALTVRDLVVSRGGRQLLTGGQLQLEAGRSAAILGVSGVGKSSLAQALSGLGQASGHCEIFGDVADMSPWLWRSPRPQQLRDRVAVIGQNPHDELNPAHDVLTQVARGARTSSWSDALTQAERWLERFGVADIAHRRPSECSGGQRQRAVVARALIAQPDLVIADEPTAALDAHSQQLVLDAFTEVMARGGAVVIITHEPDAAAWADTCYVVDESGIHPTAQAEQGASV